MNKLQKIAEILGLTLSSNEVVETLAAEAKLIDGTVIKTEADGFVVGAAVIVVAADGTEAPAMAGEYELEDNSYIVVDDMGVITEVKPAEAAVEPVDPNAAPEVAAEEMSDDEVKFNLSEEDYNTLLERISKLEEVLLGAVESLSKTNKELNEKVEKLSAQPAAEPVKTRKPVVEENALASLKLPRKK